MKTINPNSLVAIKPSVLSVGGRASPGVYNCPCCEVPSEISCAGAIDTATMVTVFSPNATIETTGFTMDVNGKRRTFNILENSDPVEWLTYEFPDVEFTGPFGETINNRGSENLRVMYRYEPPNQDAALSIEFTDNVTGGSSVDNPDGFATVCLAPSTCVEQGVDIIINRSIPLPAGTYYMEYQLNDGDWQRIEKTYSAQVHADDLGSSLFRIFDENGLALIDTGGGGNGALDEAELQYHPTPFESYRARVSINASPLVPFYRPELAIQTPTTLKFRASLGMGTDAVPLYFGGDVELHACTYAFWPGL